MKWAGWISPRKLQQLGVLGLNARNFSYIQKYNDRQAYPLVDNKLQTKKLALKRGLKTPPLYGVVEHHHQIKTIHKELECREDFVIKPARGSGGTGILVIANRFGDSYTKASGVVVSKEYVNRYLSNVLSGLYSLGGQPDQAMIEYRIKPESQFEKLSYQGVPDIRLLVFRGFPVMAMLRLSTSSSDGKANLHQGAIGIGLDIATGKPLQAVQHNRIIRVHPDTEEPLDKIDIANWPELLKQAALCYEATGLGYLGVDLVVDKEKGPLILELNARPGLSIQLANGMGLLPRLHKVEQFLQQTEDEPELAKKLELSTGWFAY